MRHAFGAKRAVECITVAIIGSASGCDAQESSPGWKADCVGRMQLSFPGDVEVAAVALPTWLEKRRQAGADRRVGSSFLDGQRAGWSQSQFLGGLLITQPLAPEERQAVVKEVERGRQAVKKLSESQLAQQAGTSYSFRDLSVSPQSGYAWDFAGSKSAQLFIADHHFAWQSYSGLSEADLERHFRIVISGLSVRATFTLPRVSGICAPYTFIRDDGQQRRSVATTYRLLEHPDVTILLKDSSAAGPQADNPRRDIFTAEYGSNDFWSQYKGIGQRVASVWSPAYRSTKLAGQKGLASFVEITREDGIQDFGYLAVAPGDPEAKEDAPDLMLYVIRDAKNAKAKGVEPIGKEALLEMAQTISASVKRRPVQ
jgi:hypothetical protein